MILLIKGSPIAQGRPRFARIGQGVRAYDPGKSREWKAEVKRQAIQSGVKVQEGPLYMILHFQLPRPKSLPKKVVHHVKKPDIDNLAKACLDGLKGIAFRDDSQIVRLAATKEYHTAPGVRVEIISA